MENFNTIYQQHYPMIYRLVSGLVPDNAMVADIIQEVFAKLYLQFNAGVTIEFPKTWLYRVATNDCLNYIKRAKKNHSLESVRELENDISESVESQLSEADNRRQIKQALSRMKDNERALLVLYSEGLSYKEIADITGIKFSSVGKTLSRTLEKLKQILKNEKYEMSY